MAAYSPVGSVENMARTMNKGDTVLDPNLITTVNSTVALAPIPVAAFIGGIVNHTGVLSGGTADTTPTADQIVAGISPDSAHVVAKTFQYRLRYINNASTQTITMTGGTGVTVSGTATIATNTWREFLIEVLASRPSYTTGVTTTNASASLTGFLASDLGNRIDIGSLITATGVTAGTFVIGISPTGTITMSANATATGTNVQATFSPRVLMTSIGSGTI